MILKAKLKLCFAKCRSLIETRNPNNYIDVTNAWKQFTKFVSIYHIIFPIIGQDSMKKYIQICIYIILFVYTTWYEHSKYTLPAEV